MIWRAVRDLLAGDLADDLGGVREGARGDRASRSTVLVVTWSGLIRVDSGMSTVATTTGPVVGATTLLRSLRAS